jgi:hypothetical protein
MVLGEKKQTMLISMFTKISHEERECVVVKEFDQLKTIATTKREIQNFFVEKCQVRCPKQNTMLICPSTIKQEDEEQDARRKKCQHLQKKRYSYNMWFTKDFFPPIQEAVKRYGRTQVAIHYWKLLLKHLKS